MSLAKASLWTAASTLVKIGAGLLVGKLLAVSFGPAGLGLAANFRQLITVLGVLAGAGIFNGVTKYVAQYHDNPQQLRRVVGTSSAMVLGFSTLMALRICNSVPCFYSAPLSLQVMLFSILKQHLHSDAFVLHHYGGLRIFGNRFHVMYFIEFFRQKDFFRSTHINFSGTIV